MKKRYMNPSIVVVDMETEVMINASPQAPTVVDDETIEVAVGEEWSLETPPNVWDEEW